MALIKPVFLLCLFSFFLFSLGSILQENDVVIIERLMSKEYFVDEITLENYITNVMEKHFGERWIMASPELIFKDGFSIIGDGFNTKLPYYVQLRYETDTISFGPLYPVSTNEIIVALLGHDLVQDMPYTVTLLRENSVLIPFKGASTGHSQEVVVSGPFVCGSRLVTTAGVYTEFNPQNPENPHRYCLPDMVNDGPGWTLLMQTRNSSEEDLAANLNTILNTNVGTPTSLGSTVSYSLARSEWHNSSFPGQFNEYLYLAYPDGTEKPYSPAFSFVLRSSLPPTTLFPDTLGHTQSPLDLGCSLEGDGSRCYSDLVLLYTGLYHFGGGICSSGINSYAGGMWGVCSTSRMRLCLNEIFGGVVYQDTCKLQLYANSAPSTRLFGRYSADPLR